MYLSVNYECYIIVFVETHYMAFRLKKNYVALESFKWEFILCTLRLVFLLLLTINILSSKEKKTYCTFYAFQRMIKIIFQSNYSIWDETKLLCVKYNLIIYFIQIVFTVI